MLTISSADCSIPRAMIAFFISFGLLLNKIYYDIAPLLSSSNMSKHSLILITSSLASPGLTYFVGSNPEATGAWTGYWAGAGALPFAAGA